MSLRQAVSKLRKELGNYSSMRIKTCRSLPTAGEIW
ncbi:hypothetical protein OROHE_005994 [Orobanche hederae]